MTTLVIYGILAAIMIGGFAAYHHSITVDGERIGIQKQLAADKPIIEACKASLDQSIKNEQAREAELAGLRDSAKRQSDAIDQIAKRSAAAIAGSKAALQQQAQSQAAFDAERQRLNAIATSASDAKLTCEQRLATIEPLVDDALRRLRQQSATPANR
jgi:hypothetical protein